jgi:hypothetical protein
MDACNDYERVDNVQKSFIVLPKEINEKWCDQEHLVIDAEVPGCVHALKKKNNNTFNNKVNINATHSTLEHHVYLPFHVDSHNFAYEEPLTTKSFGMVLLNNSKKLTHCFHRRLLVT